MELATVQKLAALARLKIGDAEAEELRKELSSILEYVSEIESASVDAEAAPAAVVETVVRPDALYASPLADREELLDASLLRKGDHIEVQAVFE